MNINQGISMTESMQSESINELAEALSKAQAEIEGATKDSTNPFHKSKYADLHSVIICAKEALAANGLSVVQPTQIVNGQLCLITILMHKSGQWIKGIVPLLSDKTDPQSIGKAFTYYRRYAYSSLLNISQYDDDAESAMERKKVPKEEPAEMMQVGPKQHSTDDLVNKILNDKKYIPNQTLLKKFLQEKATASGKTVQQALNSAMKDETQFSVFYEAFRVYSSANDSPTG